MTAENNQKGESGKEFKRLGYFGVENTTIHHRSGKGSSTQYSLDKLVSVLRSEGVRAEEVLDNEGRDGASIKGQTGIESNSKGDGRKDESGYGFGRYGSARGRSSRSSSGRDGTDPD